TAAALSDALSMSDDVVAVKTVFADDDADDDIEARWAEWDPGVRLVTLRTEYHSVVRPITRFVRSVRHDEGRRIVVLVPVIVPKLAIHRLLHNQMDLVLRAALAREPDIVVARSTFRIDELAAEDAHAHTLDHAHRPGPSAGRQ
ncbi:MAG TPA: hypothetical protein VGS21_10365, partial [Acidimicrobiales bacterium]|nr:hypothetical protein [Acidimicrobiales bacterium]